MNALVESVLAALRPLDDVPRAPGWNRAELEGLCDFDEQRDAAVLLAMRACGPDTELLFTRRTKQLRQHAGQVSFPGGRIEHGDSDAIAAALREAEEEIGLPSSAVRTHGFLDCMHTITGFSVIPVVASIVGTPELRIDPSEVAELFTVPLAFALDPDNLQRRKLQTRIGERSTFELRYREHHIWGATASILFNLQRRMGLQ